MTNDLRAWLEKADARGWLKKVDGADWDLEIGGIAELSRLRDDSPALLFDHIKGYPPGFRVAANTSCS
ncbi:MAG: UbiD family decarboxylase, partial [Dehalococcoidia bacterium]|nr:UbiD family decarboxylase [Dehalococcoidia bacterium]